MSLNMEKELNSAPLHIVMLPWLTFNHFNPFFELSNRISRLGHKITFLSTQLNIDKLLDSIESSTKCPTSICFVSLDGHDLDSLGESFQKFLEHESPTPDWLIHEFPDKVISIAASFGIKCVLLSLLGAAANAFMWSAIFEPTEPKLDQLTKPPKWDPLRTSLVYKPYEARQLFAQYCHPAADGITRGKRIWSAFNACDVVAFRSCAELEGEWLDLLPKFYNKPVLPIGYFPPSSSNLSDLAVGAADVKQWLNEKQTGSVLYVAFGSEDFLTQDSVCELANGLELSNIPFLFALRSPAGGKPFELPEGFEERTSNRGVVCKGWVPQVEILGHPSVGGFLTHRGSSSLVETFQFGQALIPFPFSFDQCFYARLIVEKGIGVEIPRNENDGSFSSLDVAKTIRLVMAEEEGKKIREKAKDLKRVIGREELHDQYVKNFIKYLAENRCSKNKLDKR